MTNHGAWISCNLNSPSTSSYSSPPSLSWSHQLYQRGRFWNFFLKASRLPCFPERLSWMNSGDSTDSVRLRRRIVPLAICVFFLHQVHVVSNVRMIFCRLRYRYGGSGDVRTAQMEQYPTRKWPAILWKRRLSPLFIRYRGSWMLRYTSYYFLYSDD